MKTILLTSIGSATSVNLLKLLKGKYRIVAVDSNPFGYTAGSMMADAFYQVPLAIGLNYLQEIQRVVDIEKVDLIIPIHDEEVRVLSQYIESFSIPVLVSTLEAITLFGDKWLSMNYIQSLGIDTPKVMYDDKCCAPCIKRNKKGVGSNGIEIFKEGLLPQGLLKLDYTNENYFVQELVNGEEYTVDVAADQQGRPFLIIPRQRVEVKSGVATKVRIIFDEALINVVQRIYSDCCIPGFSNVQFIKRDNHYFFIELNCRYGGMSIASSLASYNYPADMVAHYIDGAMLPQGVNQFPIKWEAIVTRYYEEKIYEA